MELLAYHEVISGYGRARPVHFAIKNTVGQELDQLEKDDILMKVDYQELR